MPAKASIREVERAWIEGRFVARTIKDGDLTAATLDNTAVGADVPALQAYLEVGEDSPTSDALALVVGQPADDQLQTVKGRPEVDLETGADAEAAAGTEWALGRSKQSEVGQPDITDFEQESDYDPNQTNKERIPPLEPVASKPILAGEYLQLYSRSPSSQTLELANHTLRIPVMVWDGR